MSTHIDHRIADLRAHLDGICNQICQGFANHLADEMPKVARRIFAEDANVNPARMRQDVASRIKAQVESAAADFRATGARDGALWELWSHRWDFKRHARYNLHDGFAEYGYRNMRYKAGEALGKVLEGWGFKTEKNPNPFNPKIYDRISDMFTTPPAIEEKGRWYDATMVRLRGEIEAQHAEHKIDSKAAERIWDAAPAEPAELRPDSNAPSASNGV